MKNFINSWEMQSTERRFAGFTMAEILLSLTIIGVVAAITLPSLTGNINERTWNTQRKALYARFSQAIALMPALNGYGTFAEDADGNVTEDTAAETFVTNGLSKVLKINNICDGEHLADCGIPSNIITNSGSKVEVKTTLYDFHANFSDVSAPNTEAAAFETANGESILAYYNPKCKFRLIDAIGYYNVSDTMCANFVYDLNGTKGPNTFGKDIGVISAFYPMDSVVVAPLYSYLQATSVTFDNARKICQQRDNERLANLEEASSLFVNNLYIGVPAGNNGIWTSTMKYATAAQAVNFGSGTVFGAPTTEGSQTHRSVCVAR